MNDTTGDKLSISHRVREFLSARRTLLLVVSAALVGGIIVAVGFYQYLDGRAEHAARAVELVEADWDEYLALSDEEKSESELPEQIRTAITAIRERYAGSYGDLRGRFILASLEWELGNYEAAAEWYLSIADDYPRSHLVGVSLAAAAAASEMNGEIDTARDLLTRVADGEGMPNSEQARAIFNLGRIAESREEWQIAYDLYNRLVDEHGESSWTNLGRDRIIWLTSRGLAGDE